MAGTPFLFDYQILIPLRSHFHPSNLIFLSQNPCKSILIISANGFERYRLRYRPFNYPSGVVKEFYCSYFNASTNYKIHFYRSYADLEKEYAAYLCMKEE